MLPLAGPAADVTAVAVLDAVWREGRAAIHPPELAEQKFTPAARARLESAAREAADLYAFAPALNDFLGSLGRSHTGFHHDRTLDFYLYRSMFTTRELDRPAVSHAGLQHRWANGHWVVREVWNGYPAEAAGIQRGDVLLEAEGVPYDPYRAFNPTPAGPVVLEIDRQGQPVQATLTPVRENPNRSLLEAMQNSVRIIPADGRRIGYVHLWAGTHPRMLESYLRIVGDLQQTDALVLDLRGGFGGTWYEYLDPYFASRDGFFSYAIDSRDGRETFAPGERPDVVRYHRPLVVLINGGTRSGKEALAWQFKRSGRATLVGQTTRGAFTAGLGVFTDPELPFFMSIATAEYLLEGEAIEGVGVAPDVPVAFSVDGTGSDPQLARAIELARRGAGAQAGPTMRPGSTIRSNSAASR